jgi:hypothetical protein
MRAVLPAPSLVTLTSAPALSIRLTICGSPRDTACISGDMPIALKVSTEPYLGLLFFLVYLTMLYQLYKLYTIERENDSE